MTAFDLSCKGCDGKRKLQGAAVLEFSVFSNYHNSNDLVNSASGSFSTLLSCRQLQTPDVALFASLRKAHRALVVVRIHHHISESR
jgi:hypothetical protein